MPRVERGTFVIIRGMAGSYNKANVNQIGKRGNWKSLGLPSLRDIEYDPTITKTRISDAYRRLRAGETVRHPHEVWQGEQKTRRIYIRMVSLPNGGKVINAVDETNHVLSWHSNASQYDYWRKGTLLFLRA